MQYIIPIKRHSGLRVRISQPFGANPTIYSQFKDEFGNSLMGHNGVDLALGAFDFQKMYGTNLYSCCDGNVAGIVFDNPMSTKGNGVYINSNIYVGSDGKQRFIQIVYWHLMEVDVGIQTVKFGEKIGDMGNSGWVLPLPTPSNPYNGTHLHLGFYPYILENSIWKKEFPANGYDGAIDPLPFLGVLNPIGWEYNETLEDILDKLSPIKWAIQKIQEAINNLKK